MQSFRKSRQSRHGVKTGLGKAALHLLATLADGGSCVAAGQEADALIATDLAVRGSDGLLAITPSGRAHLARAKLARNSEMDPFLGQHLGLVREMVETPSGAGSANIDTAESPLAWLARRKGRDGRALIEPEQVQAGERLRADFTRAQMMPHMTSNWSAVAQDSRGAASVGTYSDAVVGARQRVRQALEAAGPEFAGLLIDVCCFLKGLEDLERERGWPPRSAKVVLQLGLDRLARHYGYAGEACGKPYAPLRTWLADDAAFVVE